MGSVFFFIFHFVLAQHILTHIWENGSSFGHWVFVYFFLLFSFLFSVPIFLQFLPVFTVCFLFRLLNSFVT